MVLFQAIDQSPPFFTILDGSTVLKEISRSPNFSTLDSSCVVDSWPLSTALRLTALPLMIFFHSESGNSGQSGSLTSDRLVASGSMVWAWISLRVLARVSCKTVCLSRLLETHVNTDSSTLTLLELGSPSSDWCPSEIDTEGLAGPCSGMNILPFLVAALTSKSWLSTVAMNDPKAASVLVLSFPRAATSLNWSST